MSAKVLSCSVRFILPLLALLLVTGPKEAHAINIFSRVRDMVSGGKDVSREEVDSLRNSGGALAAAVNRCPEPRRDRVFEELVLTARELELSKKDFAALWDKTRWENRTFEEFWDHVARVREDDRWKAGVRAVSGALGYRPGGASDLGGIAGIALNSEGGVILLGSKGLICLEKPSDKDAAFLELGGRDLDGLDYLGAAAGLKADDRAICLIRREQEIFNSPPVVVFRGMTFSVGLEKAVEALRAEIPERLETAAIVSRRDDSGLLRTSNDAVVYWERFDHDGGRAWITRRFAFREIETVFLDSELRNDHAAIITVTGVVSFDRLNADERRAFRVLKREVENVEPRALWELRGMKVDNRLFLYELPEVAECLSAEMLLEKDEVLLALAGAGTARLNRESIKSLGLSMGNVINLTGTVTGVAGRLGSQLVNRGLNRVSFAAVTDRRFLVYRNGEVKTYNLAEGLPFALKKDKVLAHGVDFYERDFFEDGKALLEDVHESLARKFLDASRKIVSGNYDFSIAGGESGAGLPSVSGLRDRLQAEKDSRLEQARDRLEETVDADSRLSGAKAALGTAFELRDNEKGYAGMVRTFIEQKSFEQNQAMLTTLRNASNIPQERAAEIERQVRREMGLLFEVLPNETGFVGMVRKFAEVGELERNETLLQSLAEASGISPERREALIRFVTGEGDGHPSGETDLEPDDP